MSLTPILIISGFSLAVGLVARGQWRSWALMIASIFAIYWLQPSTPIRNLDFWLPTVSLGLSCLVWAVTLVKDGLDSKLNIIAVVVIAVVIASIGATRYLGDFCCLTPSRPPVLNQILVAIAVVVILGVLVYRYANGKSIWIYSLSFLILLLLVIMKFEPFTKLASVGLRSISGQSIELASEIDIRWLGFSYVAFRLFHTLIDRLNGRLPGLNLQEFIIYIIFYPAYSAGPIDRVQRFIRDLHQPLNPTIETTLLGVKRILVGIFRKFVLADSLAIFALSSINAGQIESTSWLWVMLYAYAFRIYFDFSGYIDIAIGIGQLIGVQLPENFDKPYSRRNLTLFWNSWHMTLANWFRAYFFNPLTRKLRSQPQNIPLPIIIFIGQFSTFLLIGLWHGITWNFAIWGAWHGVGLFIHNRWSEMLKSRGAVSEHKPWLNYLLNGGSIILTFHYVSLGWIWFALASPLESWLTILKLFGLS